VKGTTRKECNTNNSIRTRVDGFAEGAVELFNQNSLMGDQSQNVALSFTTISTGHKLAAYIIG